MSVWRTVMMTRSDDDTHCASSSHQHCDVDSESMAREGRTSHVVVVLYDLYDATRGLDL